VSVQSDVILTELQQHLFQRWTASSGALWMSWLNSGVYRLHGSDCALWTLASQWHFTLF